MGCGCGGRKNNQRPNTVVPKPASSVNARQVQVQPAQRQAQAQQAREQAQPPAAARNFLGAREEMEKRRRIQVSLRKRQQG